MKKSRLFWTAGLFAVAALQACSDKTVTAPAAVLVPAPSAAAAPAPAPVPATPALLARSATLQCADRKIDLEATCLDLNGSRLLACTHQTLTVSDSATGKKLNAREFAPEKAQGSDPAVVADQFSDISCVTTKSDEKFIVATMGNGGNCEACEWVDVYSWDGALIGSDRAKDEKVNGVKEAVAAAFDPQNPPIGKSELPRFYSAPRTE